MSGFFGVATKEDCFNDVFFGTDYHSHLGTRRAGIAIFDGKSFNRSIHNIETAPFRSKFQKDIEKCLSTVFSYDKVHIVSGNPEVLYTGLITFLSIPG